MKIQHRTEPGSKLVRDWLAQREPATAFYPGHPGELESYDARLGYLRETVTVGDRERIAATLKGGGERARERLQAFVDRAGFAVTTGQQPVLFGGPLYVLYKALTTLALARRLEDVLAVPVLPVFWIASEDHDWDEARAVSVLDQENDLRSVALDGNAQLRPPLHRVFVGDRLEAARSELDSLLPRTDFSGKWTALLGEACESSSTLPELMGALLAGLLGDVGLFTIQAHSPELKASTRDLLLDELARSQESEVRLREAGTALETAGYDLQVPVLDDATNLFLEGPAGRERILRGPEGFRLRKSGEEWTLEQIRRRVSEEPAVLSPNVLLRPVVESLFLPTLAYVAGPGEAAYLAQTAHLFEAHSIERPVVHPRMSLELIEGKVEKVLQKYELEVPELSRPFHELAGELVREDIPEELRRELGEFRGAVGRHSGRLGQAIREVDPTLKGPVEQVRSQAFAQLDEVERKVVQALKRENEIALAQLEKAQKHLFPGGAPQERVLSFWYYLFRYGPELLDALSREAAVGLPAAPGKP